MTFRRIIIIAALSLGITSTRAADRLTVRNVTISKEGKATLAIETEFEKSDFIGYQLDVTLPKGLSISKGSDDKLTAESYTELEITGSEISATETSTTYRFVAAKMGNPSIPTGTYVLMTANIEADGTLDVGSVVACSVKSIVFSDTQQSKTLMDDVPFSTTISNRVVLDENSPVVPIATGDDVDLLVKRTINAGEWSTICFPFDIDGTTTKQIFGNDVQLAEFDSYEKDDDGKINVVFAETDVTSEGISSNWPYVIKTSNNITEFEVTATVDPQEEDAVAEYEVGRGKNKRTAGTFTGTLHAGILIPENNLFLNSNKFYYSVGKTKCKAFRAYFWFEDVLADIDNANSRVTYRFEGKDVTGVRDTIGQNTKKVNCIYNLQGQRIKPTKKGVYLRGGRKVIVK